MLQKEGASAEGIDISESAVMVANEKAKKLKANNLLKYYVADACDLPFEDNSFTHVLGGCNFAFIQNRLIALNETHRCLNHMEACAFQIFITGVKYQINLSMMYIMQ